MDTPRYKTISDRLIIGVQYLIINQFNVANDYCWLFYRENQMLFIKFKFLYDNETSTKCGQIEIL